MRPAHSISAAMICLIVYGITASPIVWALQSDQPSKAKLANAPRGRVYLFRGFAGLVFSRGTDQLAEKLAAAGLETTVNEAVMCNGVAVEAIREYRREPLAIIVVGHSVGAACAIGFAATLNAENIPIKLIVTTDPARITKDVPANVERYINIFQSNSLLGGRAVNPGPGFKGRFASYDVIRHTEISHINMEKRKDIQDQLVAKIVQLVTSPTTSVENVSPIYLNVPAGAAIELWDCGVIVFARNGDTLQTLASAYNVPLWAVSELNAAIGGDTLIPGQRIVVPQYVVPPVSADDLTHQKPRE